MSCTGSAQAHGTFQDASAFFSEDEWKLLQGWQKELYRNVMKEIHQALISLGPLIAATVSSLRGKDQQELFPLEHRSADTRTCIDPSSGNKLAEGDVLLRVTHKEPKCHPHPEDSEWRQRHLNHRAEDPYLKSDLQSRKENVISLLIDHFGAEIGESTTDPNSEAEVVSFRIKDEDETYGKEHPGSPGTQAIGSPRGEGILLCCLNRWE
ncbi:hypothetical protein NDU88_008948 [Pleurodeles waltl]|uniref:KRAB domain-containing protein n=1 Tax=Pleurodeles waltl TaxID=8319 RepID=A0AAV7N6H8_PLEWA|nr:hypothetical protein NDU88_008948 [Pleurodeles waltl]